MFNVRTLVIALAIQPLFAFAAHADDCIDASRTYTQHQANPVQEELDRRSQNCN